MKKLITFLLTAILVLSLMTVYVSAEEKNFAEGVEWNDFNSTVTKSGSVYSASGITTNYASPAANIFPALRTAIGNNGLIHATITFEVRAVFTKGATDKDAPGRVIIRGVNADSSLNGADGITAWEEEYFSALDGDKGIFSNSKGQVIASFHTVSITESWSEVTLKLDLTQNQINNGVVNRWNLCFDKLDEYKNIEKLEVKNLTVNATVDPNVTAKPKQSAPAGTSAPAATRVPHTNVTPSPEPTPAHVDEGSANGNEDLTPVIITAIVCAVIIGACIVSVIIVKKKTSK